MKNLSQKELLSINGGTDNCPMKAGKGPGYYIGYVIGWLFD